MPELPEAETIKNVIEPQIKGVSLRDVTVHHPQVIAYPSAEEFANAIVGQAFSHMERRGKFLIFVTNRGDRLILHLRMTGCLLCTPKEYPIEKHTHIVLPLSNGMELRFCDTRRFGRFWFIRSGENDPYSGIDRLGMEPFDDGLTAAYLLSHFGKSKKAIKGCLLNQGVIAGIGNIYSDEILFSAGISPISPANTLTDADWQKLANAIPERLAYFIEKNRITPDEYLVGKGKDYRNTPYLQVYGHGGEPCPVCGEILCRTMIGGRSSVFCPKCQKQ